MADETPEQARARRKADWPAEKERLLNAVHGARASPPTPGGTGPMSDEACTHCGKDPVMVSCMIPAELAHSGRAYHKRCPIDACIADLVHRLNANTLVPVTAGSCCGHGRGPGSIMLADGRELIIKEALDHES